MNDKYRTKDILSIFCEKAVMPQNKEGINGNKLFYKISKSLGVPNSCVAIDDLRIFLDRIMPKIMEIGKKGDAVAEWMIEWYLEVCRENEFLIDDLKIKRNQNKINGYKTLRPYTSSNPLYAAITSGCEGEYCNEYDWLLIHTLLVWIDIEKISSRQFLINFCRASRSLGEQEAEKIREIMPSFGMTTKDYRKALIEAKSRAKIHWHGYEELIRFIDGLDVLYNYRIFNPKNSKGRGRITGSRDSRGLRMDEIRGLVTETTAFENENGNTRLLTQEGDKKYKTWIQEDGTNDQKSDGEIHEVNPSKDAFKLKTPEVGMLDKAGAAKAIANRNQVLPTHWGRLTPHEMVKVLTHVNSIIDDTTISIYKRKSAVAILISLLYGQTIERVSTLITYKKTVRNIASSLAFCINEKVMLVETKPVFYKTVLASKAKELVRKTVSILPLGCPVVIVDALASINKDEGSSKKSGDRVFNIPIKQLKEICREIINDAVSCSGRVISLEMISRYIPLHAADIANDLTDAVLMTGCNLDQLASQPYYTARPVKTLQRLYAKSVSKMATITYQQCPQLGVHNKLSVNIPRMFKNNEWIGARAIPTQKSIKNLVQDIQKSLSKIRKSGGQRRIEFHNLFSCYIVLMLDYATAARSVRFKYHFEEDIDLAGEAAIITDKDFADYYNSRIVALSEFCIKQLIIYRKWVKGFCSELPMLNIETFFLLTDSNNQNLHSLKRRVVQEHKKNTFGFIFFIGNNMKPKAVSPEQIRVILKNALGYVWPLNLWANRGYIRTELRLRNVHDEKIDAMLGHWNYGQSAQGKYSTFDWEESLSEMRENINEIMLRDGWRIENGL